MLKLVELKARKASELGMKYLKSNTVEVMLSLIDFCMDIFQGRWEVGRRGDKLLAPNSIFIYEKLLLERQGRLERTSNFEEETS